MAAERCARNHDAVNSLAKRVGKLRSYIRVRGLVPERAGGDAVVNCTLWARSTPGAGHVPSQATTITRSSRRRVARGGVCGQFPWEIFPGETGYSAVAHSLIATGVPALALLAVFAICRDSRATADSAVSVQSSLPASGGGPSRRTGVAVLTAGTYDGGQPDVPGGMIGPVERVVVVGAGIAGLTVANALAHAGVACVVVEATGPGRGSATYDGPRGLPGGYGRVVDSPSGRESAARFRGPGWCRLPRW